MEYVETHMMYGYDFGKIVGFKEFFKPLMISIFLEENTGKYFATDQKGANITGVKGYTTVDETMGEALHTLMCHGASEEHGEFIEYLSKRIDLRFVRKTKRLNFISMKLNGIIK